MPPDHPEPAQVGEPDFEEYATYLRGWMAEIRDLYDRVIPDDCRLDTTEYWEMFLSMCACYDPPDTELLLFADTFEIGGQSSLSLEALDRSLNYEMVAPPIRWMRDPEKAERTWEDFYWRLIEALLERYVKPQGLDAGEVIKDVLNNTPGLWEGLHEDEMQNPSRPFIEVKPHHTEEDVRNAFRMLAAAHTERPKLGRPPRDPLMAVEAAILHDRHGWTYEQLADRYGWQDYTLASKYLRDGRKLLKGG